MCIELVEPAEQGVKAKGISPRDAHDPNPKGEPAYGTNTGGRQRAVFVSRARYRRAQAELTQGSLRPRLRKSLASLLTCTSGV